MPVGADVRRRGIVYGVNVLDHDTGVVMVADYIGKTRQRLPSRARQHRETQPWEDLIVGDFYPLAQGMWTEAELDEVEARLIRERRPRLNHEYNLDNPNRIPIYTQRDQRHQRDDQMNRPRWVPIEERQPEPVPVVAPARALSWRPKAVAWWLGGAWLVLAAALWVSIGLLGLDVAMPLPAQIWMAAFVAAVAVGVIRTRMTSPRRRLRAARR